jgi:hypothetical protein
LDDHSKTFIWTIIVKPLFGRSLLNLYLDDHCKTFIWTIIVKPLFGRSL